MTAYPQKITVEEMRASGVKWSPPFKSFERRPLKYPGAADIFAEISLLTRRLKTVIIQRRGELRYLSGLDTQDLHRRVGRYDLDKT